MSSIEIQIMSDVHLETPLILPYYSIFKIKPSSRYLALLGDIGYVSDDRLFTFLTYQLQQFQIVFFLLGNHEPYWITFAAAMSRMQSFAEKMEKFHQTSTMGRFVWLDQKRFDVSETVTVLGCTLFSRITEEQRKDVELIVTDFSAIKEWTVEGHNAAHESDLAWLNNEVSQIEQENPCREVIIFTHHCPTVLPQAQDQEHKNHGYEIGSAWSTDLSREKCWTSQNVKLWAFGHTHFNCDFRLPEAGKRVVANQKGYGRSEIFDFDGGKVVGIQDGVVKPKRKKG